MSMFDRWNMDAEIERENKSETLKRLPVFEEITKKRNQTQLNPDAPAFVPQKKECHAFANRCVFSKEDDADYLMNSYDYNHNDRDF